MSAVVVVFLVLIVLVLAIPFMVISAIINHFRKTSAAKREAERIARMIFLTQKYFSELNQVRIIPSEGFDLFLMKRGEFPIYQQSGVNMLQVKAHRQSIGGGVRVSKRFWVSNRHYLQTDYMALDSIGDIGLTNKRIVFASDKKTISVTINEIIGLHGTGDMLHILTEKRVNPLIFQVTGAFLIKTWIEILKRTPLVSCILPENMNIDLGYDGGPNLALTVSFDRVESRSEEHS